MRTIRSLVLAIATLFVTAAPGSVHQGHLGDDPIADLIKVITSLNETIAETNIVINEQSSSVQEVYATDAPKYRSLWQDTNQHLASIAATARDTLTVHNMLLFGGIFGLAAGAAFVVSCAGPLIMYLRCTGQRFILREASRQLLSENDHV